MSQYGASGRHNHSTIPVSGEDVASTVHTVHPAPLAQEGQHLIHDRDTVHLISSLPGTLPVCADVTAS